MKGFVVNLPDEKRKALAALGKADGGPGTPWQRAVRLGTAAIVALADAGGDPELLAVCYAEGQEARHREGLRVERQLHLAAVADIDAVLDAPDPAEDVADELYAPASATAATDLEFEAGDLVAYGDGTIGVEILEADSSRPRPYRLALAGETPWCSADDVHALPDEEDA